jgi:hypothetical protein
MVPSRSRIRGVGTCASEMNSVVHEPEVLPEVLAYTGQVTGGSSSAFSVEELTIYVLARWNSLASCVVVRTCRERVLTRVTKITQSSILSNT